MEFRKFSHKCRKFNVLSPDLMTESDKDYADGQRARADNRNHDGQRLRGMFDMLGGGLSAAASNVMLLASLPDQAMSSKLADRTPAGPAQKPQAAFPPACHRAPRHNFERILNGI